MNEVQRVDIQCEKILKGLIELDNYIREPIASDALELGSNSKATTNQELLKRIVKSLIQYKNRGKDLVYIGFMGHFSTGKSSTINSILRIDKGSNTYRQIGLNPIDKDITLITHRENSDSIFKVTKEGLVSIRSTLLDDQFLENIVLADTPGSGDPEDFKEIAKDFLPICDLILYFFSATNPLDQADVPLLREKHARLEFIPIKFIVTRADEFRKDEFSQLTSENFDAIKAASFKGELSQRINQVLGTTLPEGIDSIILIDNKANFNIQELRGLVEKFADISNSETQIQIHSHKVSYFLSSAEIIKSFFCEFLNNKLVNVSSIVTRAKSNIENFQNKIQVTNNELTESWSRKLEDIQNLSLKASSSVREFQDEHSSLNDYWTSSIRLRAFRNLLRSEAQSKAALLIKNSRLEILSEVESQFYKLRDKLDNIPLDSIRIQDTLKLKYYKISTDGEEEKAEKLDRKEDLLPSESISENSQENLQKIHSSFIIKYSSLQKSLEQLNDNLRSQVPVKNYQKLVESATQSLSDDIDSFFDIVKLYRSAVFSLQAKEAIADLGLGQRMDDLEAQDFTEIEKEKIKQSAKDHVFADRSEVAAEGLTKLTKIQESTSKLQNDLKELFENKSSQNTSFGTDYDDWKNKRLSELDAALIQETKSSINDNLLPVINSEIKVKIDELAFKGEQDIRMLKRERANRLLYILVLSILIPTAVYIIYVWTKESNVPDGLFLTIVLGIAIDFASSFVSLVIGKATDEFPRRIERKEREIISSIGQVSQEIVKKNIENFKNEYSYESEFSELLQNYWEELLIDKPLDFWTTGNKDFFASLKRISVKYNKLLQEYLSVVDTTTTLISAYFSSPKSNLKKLEEFTSVLKKEAIEPSFILLEETEQKLETVSSKIEGVKFW